MRYLIIIFILLLHCSCSNSQTLKQIHESLEYRSSLAYDANEYEKAISLFDSLIIKDSTNGDFYFKRGRCHMLQDNSIPFDVTIKMSNKELLQLTEAKNKPAINDFLTAIKLGFKRKVAYLDLGVIYTFLNDNIALEYFTKSLNEDSNYERAKHEIGLCNVRIKKNQHFY